MPNESRSRWQGQGLEKYTGLQCGQGERARRGAAAALQEKHWRLLQPGRRVSGNASPLTGSGPTP